MVEALGKLMRLAVDDKRQTCTLEEELSMLKYYITIQQIRFGKRLSFECVDLPEFNKVIVPKLIIQPLLENAIFYGMESSVIVLQVKITFLYKDKMLLINVCDNGSGIEPDFLQRINAGDYESKGTGIGLKNIRDRMQIHYGNTADLIICSTLGEGTQVILKIPIVH